MNYSIPWAIPIRYTFIHQHRFRSEICRLFPCLATEKRKHNYKKQVIAMRILLLFLFICMVSCTNDQPSLFKPTLEKHLTAIKSRNLEELLSTVSDSVTLILPDGERLDSKSSFSELHRSWFADPDWTIEMVPLKIIEARDLGCALVKYNYSELNSLGMEVSTRHTYLQLVFKNEKQGWKLVHDQNTRIIE